MRRLPALVLATIVLAGCLPTGEGSATPGLTAGGQGPTASPTATGTTRPSLPSQTDTEWGRIWDALPPWFPIPEGAKPAETGDGPATARLALAGGSTAKDGAAFFQAGFAAAGLAAVNRDGPLEDGSFVVSVAGPCQIEVRIAPFGGEVMATVLYGTGCPFE